jgi:hypothetical protein
MSINGSRTQPKYRTAKRLENSDGTISYIGEGFRLDKQLNGDIVQCTDLDLFVESMARVCLSRHGDNRFSSGLVREFVNEHLELNISRNKWLVIKIAALRWLVAERASDTHRSCELDDIKESRILAYGIAQAKSLETTGNVSINDDDAIRLLVTLYNESHMHRYFGDRTSISGDRIEIEHTPRTLSYIDLKGIVLCALGYKELLLRKSATSAAQRAIVINADAIETSYRSLIPDGEKTVSRITVNRRVFDCFSIHRPVDFGRFKQLITTVFDGELSYSFFNKVFPGGLVNRQFSKRDFDRFLAVVENSQKLRGRLRVGTSVNESPEATFARVLTGAEVFSRGLLM